MQSWEDTELENELNDFGDYSIGTFSIGYAIYDSNGMHVNNKIYVSHSDAYEDMLELRKQKEQLNLL